MEFEEQLVAYRRRVEDGIDHWVPPAGTAPAQLHSAMRYSLEAGGKRLRPILVLASNDLFASTIDPVPAAVAVECIHTYSLIHDDLPCIDDSALRRGQASCHIKFDEATAVLAGDALLTHAFDLLADAYKTRPTLAVALIKDLASAAGSHFLIGGQIEDLLGIKGSKDIALNSIHEKKTAALFQAALSMGALLGEAEPSTLTIIRNIGRLMGLAFQIVDDVLDATGDTDVMGKVTGSDKEGDKRTYPLEYGLEESRRRIEQLSQAAIAMCEQLSGKTDFLVSLIKQLSQRDA